MVTGRRVLREGDEPVLVISGIGGQSRDQLSRPWRQVTWLAATGCSAQRLRLSLVHDHEAPITGADGKPNPRSDTHPGRCTVSDSEMEPRPLAPGRGSLPYRMTDHFGPPHGMIHRSWSGDYRQWHLVGVEWTPTALKFTLDGVVVQTITERIPAQRMWLGLQSGLGSGSTAPNSSTPPIVDMEVDYVEIYRY